MSCPPVASQWPSGLKAMALMPEPFEPGGGSMARTWLIFQLAVSQRRTSPQPEAASRRPSELKATERTLPASLFG